MKKLSLEDEELLLKDLCARLLYGVICRITDTNDEDFITEIKPYLRPISSMTEEEKKEFKDTFNGFFQYFNHGIISDSRAWDKNEAVFVGELSCSRLVDWLNKHHFDYRGLIPMGLALEAPDGMYK